MNTYMTTEFSEKTGIPKSSITYLYNKLDLPDKKNERGHRLFTDDDVVLFKEIKNLRSKDIPFDEIKKIINQKAKNAVIPENKTSIDDFINSNNVLYVISREQLEKLLEKNDGEGLKKENEELKNKLKETEKKLEGIKLLTV